MKKTITMIAILTLLLPGLAIAKRLHKEKYYQEIWCNNQGGMIEVYFSGDRTRCDCLTDTHAVEVDFADKWAQSIGQALRYSRNTKKAPGILLIIEKQEDWIKYESLRKDIEYWGLPITVWTIKP